uniref:RWD domain-containing protein n=1 Tax=Palpitomonas bilix TaxID=652834 RepID=A0A7S3GEZ7_9EUKA|mmetsp:Transcript_4668/g.9767  ORF Transcript_4668/g.9767 Transcript_4668/m.9767 type:complete len:271 (+) Transcript_4668:182-994(+)
MDYKEEQEMEIEAIQAIYPESVNIMEEGKKYSIELLPSKDYGDPISMLVEYTDTYPEEKPKLRVLGLLHAHEQELLAELDEMMEESLGAPMVFELASHATEWVEAKMEGGEGAGKARFEEYTGDTVEDPEEVMKSGETRHDPRMLDHGTMVTPETFAEWKERFDAEMGISHATTDEEHLSGKQWFFAHSRSVKIREKAFAESAGAGGNEGDEEAYDDAFAYEEEEKESSDEEDAEEVDWKAIAEAASAEDLEELEELEGLDEEDDEEEED